MNTTRNHQALSWELFRTLQIAWRLLFDSRVPVWLKTIPLIAGLYVLFPFDLLSDPILGLGQLDDLAVLLLALRLFVGLCPRELVNEYRQGQGTRSVSRDTDIEGSCRVVDM